MSQHDNFLAYIRAEHPAIWTSLTSASLEGLVQIDEDAGTVTAANRLLLTYPGLHDSIHALMNGWAENKLDAGKTFSDLLANGGRNDRAGD